ncbi:MAG: hypothetical protein V8T45_10075 [Oscillospiraceae bacterium]
MIKVDLSGAAQFFTSAGPDYALAGLAHKKLIEKTGLGSEFTGWMELPQRIKETELEEIIATAREDPQPLQGPGGGGHRRLLPGSPGSHRAPKAPARQGRSRDFLRRQRPPPTPSAIPSTDWVIWTLT